MLCICSNTQKVIGNILGHPRPLGHTHLIVKWYYTKKN